MEIALDKSTTQIWNLKRLHPGLGFKQLRTPLTQYSTDTLGHIHYGLDNGAFTRFDPNTFERMAIKAKDDPLCDWIVMPDVVGDAYSTGALFDHWVQRLDLDEKRAYVLQDGATLGMVPWGQIECLFVGGTDAFRDSSRCWEIVLEAKAQGKTIHIGRVNTPRRIVYWDRVADSFDGSGLARFEECLKDAIATMKEIQGSQQVALEITESLDL
jgi:hypothetical protein